MAKIRTFVCFELPNEIRHKLGALQAQLKQYNADVRWVRPESIHLTLKFLGDVEESALNEIAHAAKITCQGIAPFTIAVRQAGAFPNIRRPRVFWVGVHEPEGKLKLIYERLENELAKKGYPKEDRRFSPHLTIGRVKSQRGIDKVMPTLQADTFEAGNFMASELVVMKSDLKPSGAVYSPLYKIPLIDAR